MSIVTYKIASDQGGVLKRTARIACNFWNMYIEPSTAIVVRLDVFTADNSIIAQAHEPEMLNGVTYGLVEFNTKYLGTYSEEGVTGTLVHEIGHVLGIGWQKWHTLFDQRTGRFKSFAVKEIPELANMLVELDGGPGVELAHWDESRFDRELMTGYKDVAEYVHPVTIEVMKVFKHKVLRTLSQNTPLRGLLKQAAGVVFSRIEDARAIDRDYCPKTRIFEQVTVQ